MSAIITYRNLADAGTLTLASAAGFPKENLQVRQLSKEWRSATNGVSAITLDVDLGFVKSVSVIGLLKCSNIDPLVSTVSISEDGVTWSALYNFNGASDEAVPDLPRHLLKLFDTAQLAQYVQFSLVSASGDTGGYLEAGRLWIGDAIIVPYGTNSDWSIATRERGTVDESAGLEAYPSAKPRGRELRMSFSPVNVQYAYGTADGGLTSLANTPCFQDLHTYAGAIGEVIAFPRSGGIWPRRVGVYGRLTDDSLTIRHVAGPNYSTETRVIEER